VTSDTSVAVLVCSNVVCIPKYSFRDVWLDSLFCID